MDCYSFLCDVSSGHGGVRTGRKGEASAWLPVVLESLISGWGGEMLNA